MTIFATLRARLARWIAPVPPTQSCPVCESQARTARVLPGGGIACGRPAVEVYITPEQARKCKGCAMVYSFQR